MKDIEHGEKCREILEQALKSVRSKFKCFYQCSYGGAVEYGSEYYYFSFHFRTDKQLESAKTNGTCDKISAYLEETLLKLGYDNNSAKKKDKCAFYSEETCKRDYGGNWWYYYKS